VSSSVPEIFFPEIFHGMSVEVNPSAEKMGFVKVGGEAHIVEKRLVQLLRGEFIPFTEG
jgi:hypothetical protein